MDELTVQKTRCTCHAETCGHWPYSLMLGSERITSGEKADCERLLALLTSKNTRAASGALNEPFGNAEQLASLEQRARELLAAEYERDTDSMLSLGYAKRLRANDRCEPWTFELRAITAALANRQGVEKDAARYRWLRDSRACSMQVSFNDHHNMYMSVSETMKNSQEYYDDTSAGEREKMVATDTIWTVHIYPNTPVGFNVYHAATLDTAIDAAMGTQPAGDVGSERE